MNYQVRITWATENKLLPAKVDLHDRLSLKEARDMAEIYGHLRNVANVEIVKECE